MSNTEFIENSRANIARYDGANRIKMLDMAKIYYERNGDTMLSASNLKALGQTDFRSCDVSQLVDIREIVIDKAKSYEDKLYDYLNSVKNPYQFKVGDVPVEISFNSVGKKLDAALSDYLNAS